MTMIGYTMICEQAGPKELVRDVVLVQVGADAKEAFIAWAADELLPAVRSRSKST